MELKSALVGILVRKKMQNYSSSKTDLFQELLNVYQIKDRVESFKKSWKVISVLKTSIFKHHVTEGSESEGPTTRENRSLCSKNRLRSEHIVV